MASNVPNKLWTHDFTIITLGSVVSMLGNALSGFALSLLVLDMTGSSLYYAIFIAVFTLPQMIMPIFSGAILDRFSRKRMIYTLDFISSGLYALGGALYLLDCFNFPVLAVMCFIVGTINSVYTVAYQSFYPLLISDGNYSKAYSIASVLETLAALMIPVSAFVYNALDMAPLLFINAFCFCIAAIFETRIRTDEKYIETQKKNAENDGKSSVKRMLSDIKEGFIYLFGEKGLLAVAAYFTVLAFAGGASSVITLPYFKGNYENGEYVYMIVWGMSIVGRAIGGALHYKFKLPVKYKYAIALSVYALSSVFEGLYLYFPVGVMMALCFCTGIFGVTSYTIRISATQSYVPDEKKGRFNGAFTMLNTFGSFFGELIAGGLTEFIDVRFVLSGFMALNFIGAFLFIGLGKKSIKPIYNRQQ